MKRGTIFLLCVGFLFVCINVWGIDKDSTVKSITVPIGNIVIEAPKSVNSKRSAVVFPHSVHFDYHCKDCHHTWEGAEKIKGCMTSGCHNLTKKPENSDLEIRYYKEAYHGACIGCHKDIKAEKIEKIESGAVLKDKLPENGPTGCVKCHPSDSE